MVEGTCHPTGGTRAEEGRSPGAGRGVEEEEDLREMEAHREMAAHHRAWVVVTTAAALAATGATAEAETEGPVEVAAMGAEGTEDMVAVEETRDTGALAAMAMG